MLQQSKFWTIVICIFGSVVSGYGQSTLNLVTGMTFATDKSLFNDKSLSSLPNGFFKLGLGYTSKDNISVSLDYSFNTRFINLTSTIPIWDIRRKKFKQ
jgi:hypothetical protein